jgi:hypothetical protein
MSYPESSWGKLPIDLQEQFYERAEKEAIRLKEVIQSFKSIVELEKNKILPHMRVLEFGAGETKSIAAVDGSFSPRPTETIGARFAVYSAGFLLLKGREIVENHYMSGDIRYAQYSSRDLFSLSLHVQETNLERKAALMALDKNPDLLLLDGSFLGFTYSIFRIIELAREIPDWLGEIVSETLDITERLLESGRCAGVVKRGRSRAIGGWLSVEENRVNPLVKYLDKQILHGIMRTPSILDYKELLKEPGLYRVYSRVSDLLARRKSDNPVDAFKDAREWAVERLIKALGIPEERAVALESSINRFQVKVSDENPPFELEVPVGSEEIVIKTLFSNIDNFNMATGLPIAIDLIDESVSLPVEFTRDFVREVEARVTDMYEGNLEEVKEFFTNMNPQKEL